MADGSDRAELGAKKEAAGEDLGGTEEVEPWVIDVGGGDNLLSLK